MMKAGCRIGLILVVVLSWLCGISVAVPVQWIEDSYSDFADGTVDAGGQNMYVSRDGKIRTIHRFDVNDDGYLDLFFGNTHNLQNVVEPVVCSVTSEGTLEQRALAVPGSNRVKTSDLNSDGFMDLVFSLTHDGLQTPRRLLSIAYGGPEGWSSRRIVSTLTADCPKAVAITDLNADGFPDIAVDHWLNLIKSDEQTGEKTIDSQKCIRVYWGSADGFLPGVFQDLNIENAPNAIWLAGADYDQDGHSDLAVLSQDGRLRIFWAEPFEGMEHQLAVTEISLPDKLAVACLTAADTNNDGHLDLLVGTNEKRLLVIPGQAGREWAQIKTTEGYSASQITADDFDDDGFSDLALTCFAISRSAGIGEAVGAGDNMDQHVYLLWGSSAGYTTEDVTALSVEYAYATAAGDLNNDGRADLAIAIYQNDKSFDSQSQVFFNQGGRTFTPGPKANTAGATDVAIVEAHADLPARIVFSNSVGGTLYERIPVYVYWGDADGFSPQRRWEIPCQSGHEATAADLNADGFTDFIVLYTGHAGKAALKNPLLGVNIFWGGPDGYDLDQRRTILPGQYIDTSNVADVNRDGYLDIVVGGWVKDDGVRIHYGSSQGFKPEGIKKLNCPSRGGSLLADFNRDQWLDIAIAGYTDDSVQVYWGSPDGFDDQRRTTLLSPACITAEAADLNADGWLDLMVGNYSDPLSGRVDMGSMIFWGSQNGFRYWDAQWLPGSATSWHAVADFDNDGWLDMFCPDYLGQNSRVNLPCNLYWGSPDGFHRDRSTVLFCNSASGAQTGDFNHDGLIDLAVSCHTVYGNHQTHSKVFYNDGHRFENPKVQLLPTQGSHYMWVQDMGHIYDRSYRQRYQSSIFAWHDGRSQAKFAIDATIPDGCELEISIRSATTQEQIDQQPWRKIDSGQVTLNSQDRYLQYQLTFVSDNGDRYPVVDRIAVELQ